jgi:S-adenosylmethionine:tRNA ribosyltransferase-isomerase
MVAMSEPESSTGRVGFAPGPDGGAGASRPMAEYEYPLPEESIAQTPAEPRSSARLLVAAGVGGSDRLAHRTVADLPELVGPGDVVVVNDTRVLTGRLHLTKATGGRAEVLLLEPTTGADEWEALVRPGRRLPEGTLLSERPGGPVVVEVGPPVAGLEDGRRRVRLVDPTVVERAGTVPLPPYIHRPLEDPDRYQTVYSTSETLADRSAAAPTAGLHFTPEVLAGCRRAGAEVVRLDLSIGLDTFRPVTAATAEEHVIHSERYAVPAATMAACADAERVIAVGTTAVRALESAAVTGNLSGRTDLYIHGDYRFRVVDVLITNFHLPRSSLLLLVESFCGDQWRRLYATALAEGYRFLSFGDAMMVARSGPPGPSR